MPDSWLAKYQNALQICREAAESINDQKIDLRKNQRKTSSSVNDTNEHIKKDILNVSSLAENLKIELWDPKLISSKTQGEIERRQNLLDNLMSKIQILNETFNHGRKFDNSERLELLSSSSGSGEMNAGNHWLEGDEVKSALQTAQQYHQKTVQIYEEQEEGLHVLANSLNRQKELGINIGKQADYHSEIIDEINERAVSSDNQLRHLTTRIQQVSTNRKNSTFVLWVMVILLAIALVVLALIPL